MREREVKKRLHSQASKVSEKEMEVGNMRGLMVLIMVILVQVIGRGEAQLKENFYSGKCANVETIVQQTVSSKFAQTFVTVPATLRLFFHDCFVEVRSL